MSVATFFIVNLPPAMVYATVSIVNFNSHEIYFERTKWILFGILVGINILTIIF